MNDVAGGEQPALEVEFANPPRASLISYNGRVESLVGLLIRATMPEAWVGQLCYIKNRRGSGYVKAEVVGFNKSEALLMPLGSLDSIAVASEVVPTADRLAVPVGPGLLGRILNGLGEFRDNQTGRPFTAAAMYPVIAPPPDPLKRNRVERPLAVGIKAVDGLLTCGEGQRIGLFAAAGVGKSTFLGMVARNSDADVNVIALIGERGREVNDFLEESLGADARSRSVLVVATSDEPAMVRVKAAQVATAIAEYFRDQGLKVMLMMDSVTRFARALRDVGLAANELPARGGFTPSVFSELPRLLERAGNSDRGSITAFYTVLVEGDDMNEPVADETRSILDGHIILSRSVTNRFPRIDIAESVSRVRDEVLEKHHPEMLAMARQLTDWIKAHKAEHQAIKVGAYERGTDTNVDSYLEREKEIQKFLDQDKRLKVGMSETQAQLAKLCRSSAGVRS